MGSSPAAYLLLLVPLAVATANWSRCDASGDVGAERFSDTVLPASAEVMPSGSLLLTEADADIFTSWYRQLARRERRDVLVVGLNFLRNPWYEAQFTPEQIRTYHLRFGAPPPRPFRTTEEAVENYVSQIDDMAIAKNVRERPVFTSMQDPRALTALERRYKLDVVAQAQLGFNRDNPSEPQAAVLRRISPRP